MRHFGWITPNDRKNYWKAKIKQRRMESERLLEKPVDGIKSRDILVLKEEDEIIPISHSTVSQPEIENWQECLALEYNAIGDNDGAEGFYMPSKKYLVGEKVYKCDLCPYSTTQRFTLNKHNETWHYRIVEGMIKCTQCEVQFETWVQGLKSKKRLLCIIESI